MYLVRFLVSVTSPGTGGSWRAGGARNHLPSRSSKPRKRRWPDVPQATPRPEPRSPLGLKGHGWLFPHRLSYLNPPRIKWTQFTTLSRTTRYTMGDVPNDHSGLASALKHIGHPTDTHAVSHPTIPLRIIPLTRFPTDKRLRAIPRCFSRPGCLEPASNGMAFRLICQRSTT